MRYQRVNCWEKKIHGYNFSQLILWSINIFQSHKRRKHQDFLIRTKVSLEITCQTIQKEMELSVCLRLDRFYDVKLLHVICRVIADLKRVFAYSNFLTLNRDDLLYLNFCADVISMVLFKLGDQNKFILLFITYFMVLWFLLCRSST